MGFMTEESRVAYFLGELSESESRRLEEESLRNEGLFDQLQSTEEALIDAYVRGEMTAESQTLFERNYLNTNRRREGVELATALRRKFNSRGISADRSSSASLVTRRRKVLAAVT